MGVGRSNFKIGPNSPLNPRTDPRPILKFEGPTPIPPRPHTENTSRKENQATPSILTTQQIHVKTIWRFLWVVKKHCNESSNCSKEVIENRSQRDYLIAQTTTPDWARPNGLRACAPSEKPANRHTGNRKRRTFKQPKSAPPRKVRSGRPAWHRPTRGEQPGGK